MSVRPYPILASALLKATRAIGPADEAQLIHYLAATELRRGLLLNFGSERLEFMRRVRDY